MIQCTFELSLNAVVGVSPPIYLLKGIHECVFCGLIVLESTVPLLVGER